MQGGAFSALCLEVAMAGGDAPTPGSAPADCVAQGGGEETDGRGGKGPPGGGGPPGQNRVLPFGLEVASEVKARHEDRLFAIRGVVGTGISVDEASAPVIEVYVDGPRRDRERAIPERLEGIPVRVIETGPFIAH